MNPPHVMNTALDWLLWCYLTIAIGGALLVALACLRAYLAEQWEAYLTRRIEPKLDAARRKHAADLESARKEHQEARAWLIETHRMDVARLESRLQQRVDEAVAEAMTSCARDPRAA